MSGLQKNNSRTLFVLILRAFLLLSFISVYTFSSPRLPVFICLHLSQSPRLRSTCNENRTRQCELMYLSTQNYVLLISYRNIHAYTYAIYDTRKQENAFESRPRPADISSRCVVTLCNIGPVSINRMRIARPKSKITTERSARKTRASRTDVI